MREHKRVFFSILIMVASSLVVVGMTIFVLYDTAFEQASERLVETAQSQASLIGAIARFDSIYSNDYPGGAMAATLSQLVDAHRNYKGFGETGEFTLARREGDDIVFQLSHRHHDLDSSEPIRFDSELAEPMRRSLSGRSGIVIGLDYRGMKVLAAYEPVAELNMGIVAKIDLAEVRAPYVRAAAVAGIFTVLVVLAGAALFLRVINPIIKGLKGRSAELEKLNEEMKCEIEERKRAEESLEWEAGFNAAMAEFTSALLSLSSIDDISSLVLYHANTITDSKFGYVGYIDPATGHLVCPTLTRDIWDACNVEDKEVVFKKFEGLCGWVLNNKEPILTNNPSSDPRSSGTPEGHIPIHRFLSAPAMINETLVGQVAVANSKRDYNERDLVLIERFASLYALAVQRKQAEEALRESEERYRAAIENSNDGVSIVTGDRRIFVNQRFLDIFGYEDAKEIIGKPLNTTIHPDDAEKVTDIALRRQKGETVPSRLEYKGIRKDGHTVYIETSVAKTTYRGETVSLAYLRDITGRKRAEEERIQLGKLGALGTLVAGIAHEMNNPMMGMLNFIQYCLKHTAKDDRRYPVLEDAERETKRCIDIVQNLLTFSRIEKDDEESYKKESLSMVLDRVYNLLSYRIDKENILLTQECAEGNPEIWMKVSNVQQVFLNLVGNALDAVKESEKKEIHVEIRPNGKFVEATIMDSGCGISRENFQNIFDPFFTTKPPGQGTGLGLSVCHNIIEGHGGKIGFESEVGAGTKFNVLLPIDRRSRSGNG